MGKIHFYTEEEIDYLRKISPGRTNKKITKMFNDKFKLNQSERAIEGTRKRYEIKNGVDARFKKGHKPWNKGLKGYMGANKTSFKKGEVPPNYLPIGSKRVTKDGYVEIKVADPNKWKGKHRIVWEKRNGPAPEGYAVIFGDGNNRNFNIDNLILVSRKQLLKLNQYGLIKNDAELTRTGVIIADLHSKINERKVKDD